MKILHEGQAIILGLETIDLDAYPALRCLGCNMTGTEHLPTKECEKRGIRVISLRGETEFLEGITSTAEHTIGLMIALMRNYKKAFKNPTFDREDYKGYTLAKKQFGVIGYGRVGNQVSRYAKNLGMFPYAYEKKTDEQKQLDSIVQEMDVLSIHIPLKGNEGFFTKEMFKQMKPTSYLINTSRSGIIEEGALLWALKNKEIAGAAVDFIDDPYLVEYARSHDNLILTPHLGGNTFEDREKTEEFVTNKVNEYINATI